nr:PREDICTED: leucine-rich repeats and immunoglobulin-like domains protein 1 [Austrofundulus limnaeus]
MSTQAPTFTQPLQSVVALEGSAATFEAQVSGSPVPEVSWFRDGQVLSTAALPGVQISFSDGRAVLRIPVVTAAHSGRFSVRATNGAGQATSTAELLVTGETGTGSMDGSKAFWIKVLVLLLTELFSSSCGDDESSSHHALQPDQSQAPPCVMSAGYKERGCRSAPLSRVSVPGRRNRSALLDFLTRVLDTDLQLPADRPALGPQAPLCRQVVELFRLFVAEDDADLPE